MFLFVLFFSAVRYCTRKDDYRGRERRCRFALERSYQVMIKGSSHGVATDFDGNYRIKVPNNKAVLVFSQIGMKTVEKVVGKANNIDVILREEAQELGEVVVTGVGVATDKRKVAISVDAVSEKSLKRTPVKSIDDALSGKIAGA